MNVSTKATAVHTYDAIVVGSGISGGWAAKELTEKGLKTLVLERGRDVKHGDYPTAMMETWEFPGHNQISRKSRERQAKQSRTGYTTMEATAHFFVDDIDHPYLETKRFDWCRGYHVGGRSLTWGRQSYRLCELDFEANAQDGFGVDWPIRYGDLAPWYDYVERFAGISGQNEGLSQLPDGEFLPPFELNCLEEHVRNRVFELFDDRRIIHSRIANLTQPHQGRAACMSRDRCSRGCPFGAYFSSNSSTLPAAYATGRLTMRPFSIVAEVLYDVNAGKARGVRVIDAETGESMEYFAKVVFLCASAIASTAILMNSKSDRFPTGMGNDSGELGHNLMDHHYRVGAHGRFDGFHDRYYKGRRPGGIYVPRFRNLGDKATRQSNYLRGFGYQGGANRDNWARGVAELSRFGANLKADLFAPGDWRFGIWAWGEQLPEHSNRMSLNYENPDRWGQPTVDFDCEFKENEREMRKDMLASAIEILEASGMKEIQGNDDPDSPPGLCIHEMGTARMGRNPKTSVLNGHNQVHGAPNVFVTDGACMTSGGCVNPSLTYMAFTARAADHAVNELNRLNL